MEIKRQVGRVQPRQTKRKSSLMLGDPTVLCREGRHFGALPQVPDAVYLPGPASSTAIPSYPGDVAVLVQPRVNG